jgi:hypothetical protein
MITKPVKESGTCSICGSHIEWFDYQATSWFGNKTVVIGNLAHSIPRQAEEIVDLNEILQSGLAA